MKRIYLNQVRAVARARTSKEVTVTVIPCNLYPSMVFRGFKVTLQWNADVDGSLIVKGQTVIGPGTDYADVPLTFKTWLDNFSYYNCNNECGYYAAYYV